MGWVHRGKSVGYMHYRGHSRMLGSCSNTICSISSTQHPSLNLELPWQPVSPNSLPVFVSYSAGVTDMWFLSLCWGFKLRSASLIHPAISPAPHLPAQCWWYSVWSRGQELITEFDDSGARPGQGEIHHKDTPTWLLTSPSRTPCPAQVFPENIFHEYREYLSSPPQLRHHVYLCRACLQKNLNFREQQLICVFPCHILFACGLVCSSV